MLDWLGNKNNDSKCVEVGAKLESTIFDLVKSGVKTKDIGGDKNYYWIFTNEINKKICSFLFILYLIKHVCIYVILSMYFSCISF